ncbi:hypothetical protein COO60DRAFT_1519347 [Scenedesmus sp. NREL 46B-D3]|nr:hypothetical protein COO60DRAFT_1519347 [Scenedesmus sp. NREL 46B-D3]
MPQLLIKAEAAALAQAVPAPDAAAAAPTDLQDDDEQQKELQQKQASWLPVARHRCSWCRLLQATLVLCWPTVGLLPTRKGMPHIHQLLQEAVMLQAFQLLLAGSGSAMIRPHLPSMWTQAMQLPASNSSLAGASSLLQLVGMQHCESRQRRLAWTLLQLLLQAAHSWRQLLLALMRRQQRRSASGRKLQTAHTGHAVLHSSRTRECSQAAAAAAAAGCYHHRSWWRC